MPQSSTVSHLVFARARTGQSEQLGERLLCLIEPSRNADGCLNFTLQLSLKDPDLWLISGCWASDAAMNSWLATPELQVFSEVIQTYMVSSLDFHTFTTPDGADIEVARWMNTV
ncbi:antibiotic biosynthesis monooxygenase [Pseudomonas sp. S25]|uniref:Antibiotic biosynthesis monooxygenase n=1 Tax=Pseudomonas maioricensis TaxID=1766623 RepID=A0ABS9ZJQ1_9PSED|nr:antibiotic biosynthesis monooxygenase family protein [Pseudomonas sp. S25]MCI8210316.1 antibiotic biosynthesis monooxygenase [Pseudomonas sp. S25]